MFSNGLHQNCARIDVFQSCKDEMDRPSTLTEWHKQKQSAGSATTVAAVIIDIAITETKQVLYVWHWRLRRATQMCLTTGASRRTSQARTVLFSITEWGWECIWHNSKDLSACHMCRPVIEAEPSRDQIHFMDGLRQRSNNVEDDGHHINNSAMKTPSIFILLWSVHLNGAEHQAAHTVSRFHKTGVVSQLGDDVPVLKITKV